LVWKLSKSGDNFFQLEFPYQPFINLRSYYNPNLSRLMFVVFTRPIKDTLKLLLLHSD